ncbi:tRNA adenosine(34) deaminase TadA [Candidatus Aquiluna sp. UB-MaderosW2red]|uniref:tRNA adenosine(34) deaminase TadA n=1 Tax=Candidatus Aquiluna sp. UB-MaderosW2red TaxID=1855377 RepID=UPI000875D100|nr:tRNA(adenine34) deaminase [Candidatus Aquiluna sp. UB-MaderosW2red]
MNNLEFMQLALIEAAKAGEDVPVGAILINAQGEVIARGHNRKEALKDPTSHAEIEVIRQATRKLHDYRLIGCTLIVTLEPCAMCAGAIIAARIPKVVFGAWDQRVGAAGSIMDLLRDQRLGKPIEVIPGVLEKECSAILKEFFDKKR